MTEGGGACEARVHDDGTRSHVQGSTVSPGQVNLSRAVGAALGTFSTFIAHLVGAGLSGSASHNGFASPFLVAFVAGLMCAVWIFTARASLPEPAPRLAMMTVARWGLIGVVLVNGVAMLGFSGFGEYAGFLFVVYGMVTSFIALVTLMAVTFLLRSHNRRRVDGEQ